MDIVQYIYSTGYIPQELGWTILVLIHKGNTDTQGVGLLETLLKVVEAIINIHLQDSIHFHDALHGFHVGKVTGTATMYIKITQELSSVYQFPSS